MIRTAIFLFLFCAMVAYAIPGSAIAGTWKCVSTDETGSEVAWTLDVTEQAGKLSGSITIAQTGGRIEILEPALHGDVFSFKIQINPDEKLELNVRIDGARLQGEFKGKASGKGMIKGARQ